jgi:hypothetical protein
MQEEKNYSVAVIMLLFTAQLLVPGAFAQAVEVSDCTGLQNMKDNLEDYYVLTANIDCNVTPFNTGEGFEPIGNNTHPFNGTLDGQGFNVTGLFINRPSEDNIGLFGVTGENSLIKNLGIISAGMTGDDFVGALAGINYGIINNTSSEGALSAYSKSGGLVGENNGIIVYSNSHISINQPGREEFGGLVGLNYGSVFYSHATGSISGENYLGGLVGVNNGEINDSYAIGNIIASEDYNGGLVGYNDNAGNIYRSFSIGNVQGDDNIGGFVGNNWGLISDSYATGNVTALSNYAGGFVGAHHSNQIINSYSKGFVISPGSDVGGFAGSASGNITNSFYDNDTSGQTDVGKGQGKSTADMNNINTFFSAGWDFSLIWGINASENNGYPFLLWQGYESEEAMFCGGEGTELNPYLICTPYHLHRIRYNLTAHYRLNNSIDLDVAPFNTGEGFEPIGNESGYDSMHGYLDAFRGTFDGAGYNISNLYINRPSEFNVGLFGYVSSSSSSIKNVGIIDANVRGYRYVGALLGQGYGTQVENSFSTGQVYAESYLGGLLGFLSGSINNSYSSVDVTRTSSSTSSYLGGLVGYSGTDGIINNSYATGTVVGRDFTGGFVGYNSGSYIYNSYATGDVSGRQRVGGFAGQQIPMGSDPYVGGQIHNCYATGNVTATVLYAKYTGGFIGNHYNGLTNNSYATGNVNGREEVGGFVGSAGGIIENAYSAGQASGTSRVGGLAGVLSGGAIINSFWDTEASGLEVSAGGEGKTTAQLKSIATFAEWNISLAETDLNNGYPFLAWQDDRDDFVWLLFEEEEEEKPKPPSGRAPSSISGIIVIPDNLLREGFSRRARENQGFRFNVRGKLHLLMINSIGPNSATVTVSSEPQTKTLEIGEEWEVDVNGDGEYDVLVTLLNITDNQASIKIHKIEETPVVQEEEPEGHCFNAVLDGDETDVDCGGSCPPCEEGKACLVDSDCKSGFCLEGICVVPSCFDGIKNQGESDIDCGGPCQPCELGKMCNADSGCMSGYCDPELKACTEQPEDEAVLPSEEAEAEPFPEEPKGIAWPILALLLVAALIIGLLVAYTKSKNTLR